MNGRFILIQAIRFDCILIKKYIAQKKGRDSIHLFVNFHQLNVFHKNANNNINQMTCAQTVKSIHSFHNVIIKTKENKKK